MGQSEKVETKVTVERIEVNPQNAADAYQRLLSGGTPILDAEFTTETDTDTDQDDIKLETLD